MGFIGGNKRVIAAAIGTATHKQGKNLIKLAKWLRHYGLVLYDLSQQHFRNETTAAALYFHQFIIKKRQRNMLVCLLKACLYKKNMTFFLI
jgi:hypothetical protein